MRTITIILIVLFAFVSIFFGVILIKKALNAKETAPVGIIDTGTEENTVDATSFENTWGKAVAVSKFNYV